jgi:iron complex transport system ATP-binding protein
MVTLEARGLAFGFPGRSVGRDLGFALSAGEVLCVLGPNGGGKTTLFRTLLGLLPPQAGDILLDGSSIHSLSRGQVARRAGYVPQGHAGHFAYTVREFVLMGRSSHLGAFSTPGRHDREVAERVLAALGIAHLAERAVTHISGGERQLAYVARALAQEPRLLIMDEPTASLDFGNQVRVLQTVASLASSGMAILFATHDPDQAFLCAHRALLLGEGRLFEIGAPREVIRADTLKRLYHVDVSVLPVDGGHTCLPSLRR